MEDDLRKRLDSILDRHLGWTCAAAVVRLDGPLRLEIARGVLNPGIDPRPVASCTPFDLASLTKLFTATAVLRLIASGTVHLHDGLSQYLPLTGNGTAGITIRQLLTHSSGLPAFAHLWDRSVTDPRRAALGVNATYSAGTRVEYSDVGFILLGLLVEEVTGLDLAAAVGTLVIEPLGLSTGYGPRTGAAATELDPWRGRRLQGEVHDEKAAVLGGVAGHAGLFGNAADVSALARAYLHPDPFLPVGLAEEATRQWEAFEDERRGLGWKLRSPNPLAAEAALPAEAFGHTGYTGTAVWAIPSRDTVITLLTNRVYYSRALAPITALRREVFSAIAAAIP